MPYGGQDAGKTSQGDLVRNPLVQSFLQNCSYMRIPSAEEGAQLAATYQSAPQGEELPEIVLASDGSKADVVMSEKLPSTRLGVVKISQMVILMDKEREIRGSGRYVDPALVAELEQSAGHVPLMLPGSNVTYAGAADVPQGYRQALHDQLSVKSAEVPVASSLAETLLELRGGSLQLSMCPACGEARKEMTFTLTSQVQSCPDCHGPLYATDYLRLYEGVTEEGDISSMVTRAMNALEHLILAQTLLLFRRERSPKLTQMAFVMDGPLSLNGQPARLNADLLRLIHSTGAELATRGLGEPLILGLQKTGPLAEHARVVEPYLAAGSLRMVDDGFRHRYVREVPGVTFGFNTHYGQDFIYKPSHDRVFVFSLPFPFAEKGSEVEFRDKKAALSPESFPTLARACAFIRHFQTDLYQDALIPVALAHRHASISLQPGGKVLTELARQALQPAAP